MYKPNIFFRDIAIIGYHWNQSREIRNRISDICSIMLLSMVLVGLLSLAAGAMFYQILTHAKGANCLAVLLHAGLCTTLTWTGYGFLIVALMFSTAFGIGHLITAFDNHYHYAYKYILNHPKH